MSILYERISNMCQSKGITVGKMCSEIGIQRSVMGNLSSGKTKELSTKTAKAIANYFGITIEELLFDEKTSPTQPSIDDGALMFALFGESSKNMTKEDLDAVRSFASFISRQKGDTN